PAEARNWLIDRLSEIHAGKYVGGIFDQETVEVMMPSRTERLAVEVTMPSRTERLAFCRDEYALDSFTVLQRLLAFMLSQSQQGPQMRTWLTVSAIVLYASYRVEHAAVALVTLVLALRQQGKVSQQAGQLGAQGGE